MHCQFERVCANIWDLCATTFGREGTQAPLLGLSFASLLTSAAECLNAGGGFAVVRRVADQMAVHPKVRSAGLAVC